MVDYYEHRPSNIPYGGERIMDEDDMRRSMTRGSHQSQASVAPSATSWISPNHHQGHRPFPPPRQSGTSSSSFSGRRASRPLPDPQFHQHRVPVHYEVEEERSEIPVDFVQVASNQGDFSFGYQHQNEDDKVDQIVVAGPSGSPVVVEKGSGPGSSNRDFVGGFFKGLKRLPKILKGGNGEPKRHLSRKATFGTDGTSPTVTAAAMTRGNTLPRYLSNPSIGPSNPQFAHRLSMAPNGGLPLDSTSSGLPLRTNPAGPQYPTVTLSPPSDEIAEGQRADFYDSPAIDQQMYLDNVPEHASSLRERATVMIYNTESQAHTITPASPPARRPSTSAPRVSYATELPTRANTQAQNEPLSRQAPLTSAAFPPTPFRATEPQPHSQNMVRSPPATSAYTMSVAPSFYDPSFASDLNPVEKFFKGLYNLPWVAPERVTVDYRPGDSERAKRKIKALKQPKPMPSWYRALMPGSRRASRNLDLLSDGTSSLGNTLSPLGSPSSLSRQSRRSGRSSNNIYSRVRPHRRTRNRVTSNTTSDTQHLPPQRIPSPIIPSTYPYAYPAYPYPYPYGPYPPTQAQPIPPLQPREHRTHRRNRTVKHAQLYTSYQPMAMPPPPMPMPMPNLSSQPMTMGFGPGGAPIYFISPSPPRNHPGDGTRTQVPPLQQQMQSEQANFPGQQPVQVSPVIMQLVPGGFSTNQNNSSTPMISPPLTPQRPYNAVNNS